MLINILIGLAIAFIILGSSYLYAREHLVVVRVDGDSMFPTLKDKRIYLGKYNYDLQVDKIYIYYNPQGIPVIKRLKFIKDGKCYFVGDNSNNSIDSRHYGYVSTENIIAQLIWF